MQKDPKVRQQMFSLITSWQQSSLSQKAFCQQNNLGYHVFHYWYKCFRDAQLAAPKGQGFVTLNLKTPSSVNSSCAAVELLLADGRRVIFHEPVSVGFLKALTS